MIFGNRIVSHQATNSEHDILIMVLHVANEFIWRIREKCFHTFHETVDITFTEIADKIFDIKGRLVVSCAYITR